MLSLVSAPGCGMCPSCRHATKYSNHRFSTLMLRGPCAGLLAPLAAGGAAIIPAGGRFSAGTHWRDAVEHQATFYTAVPTMHQVMNLSTCHLQTHTQVISSGYPIAAVPIIHQVMHMSLFTCVPCVYTKSIHQAAIYTDVPTMHQVLLYSYLSLINIFVTDESDVGAQNHLIRPPVALLCQHCTR